MTQIKLNVTSYFPRKEETLAVTQQERILNFKQQGILMRNSERLRYRMCPGHI